jgi:cell wall-associated NlpC family hydrolase
VTGGPGRVVAAGAAALIALVVMVGAAAGGALGGILGGTGADILPTTAALAAIPGGYLSLYQQASATCPGLSWTVLAAIGTVESSNGTSTLPGVQAGANWAGAEGPMQFEPATFAQYDEPVPPGGADPPSPYDPTDAVYAAARDLCANGARNDADLEAAIFAYNHSAAYVAQVLDLAQSYGEAVSANGPLSAAAATALAYAESQLGTPYQWGAEDPGVAFDCSGLTQAAYAAAGVTLPRTAQAQYDFGPQLPPGIPLQPGDLVFFGSGPTRVTHVGIVVNPSGEMIDAPYTDADVRVEPLPTTIGATFGNESFVGATDPGN